MRSLVLFILISLGTFKVQGSSMTNLASDSSTTHLCSNNSEKAWIDIVFILDSSIGISESGFHTMKLSTASIIEKLTIGQTSATTRVAYINLGSEGHINRNMTGYASTEEAKQALLKIPYLNDTTVNLEEGLVDALYLLVYSQQLDRQMMVVLWTSKHVQCPNTETEDICEAAATLKRAGITLVTIDAVDDVTDTVVGVADSTLAPDPCDRFNSMDTNLPQRVLDRICVANCHCGYRKSSWFRYTVGCTAYKHCIYQTEIPLSYEDSLDNCESFGGRLASVHDEQKNEFLKDTAVTITNNFIGLKFGENISVSTWSDGSPYLSGVSYNRFLQAPNPNSCTSLDGTNGDWKSNDCAVKSLSFCERPACDAEDNTC